MSRLPLGEDELSAAGRDRLVTRCSCCGEWRYRANVLPCQTCRAPRLVPLVALVPALTTS